MNKKSKLILFIVLIVSSLCVIFTGCKKIRYWEVGGEINQIVSIEVVYINNPDLCDYSVLRVIDAEDYEEIIEDVEQLPYTKYFAAPATPSGYAIKINFFNGDYDLVSSVEPRHWKMNEEGFYNSRTSWCYVRADEFNSVIEKWCEITEEIPK